jgi:hypothetical protein
VQVDAGVVPFEVLLNGPEWAQSDQGPQVLYARDDGAGPLLVRAALVDGAWVPTPIDGVPGRVGSLGSLDAGDPDARVTFLEVATDTVRWGWLDGRDGGEVGPRMEHGPRWAIGRQQLFWAEPVDGTPQVHRYDVAADEVDVLTSGSVVMGNPFAWDAPERGETVMFATSGDDAGDPVALDVLAEVDGAWVSIKRVHPPAAFPYVVSPEPFVFDGRSLVVFQASVAPALAEASEIWVAAAMPEDDLLVRVSDPAVTFAIDPEWAVIGGGPHVYYTEVRAGGALRALRVADTGVREAR